jgi:hypothetical protein
MAINADSLGLLFKIRSDSKDARDDIKSLSDLVSKETKSIQTTGSSAFIKLGESVGFSSASMSKMAAALPLVGAGIAAVAGAAIGAGVAIFGLAKNAADAGSEIYDLSQRTGASVETLSALRLVAQQSGTSLEEFAGGVSKFNCLIGEAAKGSDEATEKLKRFGIEPREALQNQEAALAKVFKVINDLPPGLQRSIAAQEAFGRGGDKLVDLIQSVGGNLEDFIEQARRAGFVMSGEAAAAADKFGDTLDELKFKAGEAARTIGEFLVPSITRGMERASEAFTKHQTLVATGAAIVGVALEAEIEKADRLASALERFAAGLQAGGPGIAAFAALFGTSQGPGLRTESVDFGNAVRDPRLTSGGLDDFFSEKKKATRARERKTELDKLKEFIKEWEFTITSTTGGRHNAGSLHGLGRAADVSVQGKTEQEIRNLMEAARSAGYGVRDERTRPAGQAVWSGPHLHLEVLSKAAQALEKDAIESLDAVYEAAKDNATDELRTWLKLQEERAAMRKRIADITRDLSGQEETALMRINALIKDAELVGAIDEQTKARLRQLAVNKDIVESLERAAELQGPAPSVGLDLSRFKGTDFAGAGPVVTAAQDAALFGPEGPPVPDFTAHMGAIDAFKSFASDAFSGITQGFGSMIEAFLLGGDLSAGAFFKMAKGVIAGIAAQATVKAIFEVAEGYAALANPFTAYLAPMHFASAKMYGLIAGVAAGAALAIPGGGGSAGISSAVGNGSGSSFNSQSSARERTIREARTGGSADPNQAQVFGHVAVDLKYPDGHVERQMVKIFSRNGPFREKLRTDLLREATA